MWPDLAHVTVKKVSSLWRLVPIAVLLLVGTAGLVYVLLAVPGLHYSVVGLLTTAFEWIVPRNWAARLAWCVGMFAVLQLGTFVRHRPLQARLDREPASRNIVYNFVLRLALWEEMAFRAGAEKWSVLDRLRASLLFGAVHILNIWYSFAAGLALSLTGFGFMAVYLWARKRYEGQIVATSIAATVHALYNTLALLLLCVIVAVELVLRLIW